MTVPQAQMRPGLPQQKEVQQFMPDDSSIDDGYLAKTKRKPSKSIARSASVDVYHKQDFVKRNMSVSRTKSVRRAPSIPKKDRFGNSISEFSPYKKSKTSRAPSLSVRHRSTVRN